jgi:hypothetical protein
MELRSARARVEEAGTDGRRQAPGEPPQHFEANALRKTLGLDHDLSAEEAACLERGEAVAQLAMVAERNDFNASFEEFDSETG